MNFIYFLLVSSDLVKLLIRLIFELVLDKRASVIIVFAIFEIWNFVKKKKIALIKNEDSTRNVETIKNVSICVCAVCVKNTPVKNSPYKKWKK
jgi:hypothetical protein